MLDPSAGPSDNLTPEERRLRALEAAEKRQQTQATRGNISSAKAKELDEAQVKSELIGKFCSTHFALDRDFIIRRRIFNAIPIVNK